MLLYNRPVDLFHIGSTGSRLKVAIDGLERVFGRSDQAIIHRFDETRNQGLAIAAYRNADPGPERCRMARGIAEAGHDGGNPDVVVKCQQKKQAACACTGLPVPGRSLLRATQLCYAKGIDVRLDDTAVDSVWSAHVWKVKSPDTLPDFRDMAKAL